VFVGVVVVAALVRPHERPAAAEPVPEVAA
jgi:hypothetical protein